MSFYYRESLFGSRFDARLKSYRSLLDNFFHICTLPFFKRKDSPETIQLKAILQACTLHSTASEPELNLLAKKQISHYAIKNKIYDAQFPIKNLKEDIATLEVAKVALSEWIKVRSVSSPQRAASSRCGLVKRFYSLVQTLQNSILTSIDAQNVLSDFTSTLPDDTKAFIDDPSNAEFRTKLDSQVTINKQVKNELYANFARIS